MRILTIRVYVGGVALALEREIDDTTSVESVVQEIGTKGFLHSGTVYYPPRVIDMVHVIADVQVDEPPASSVVR